MNNKRVHFLLEDFEFEHLLPPYTKEEYIRREQELVYHGCLRPIETWHKVILYDYLNYKICKQWDIPFETKELSFSSRYEAMFYACKKIMEMQDLNGVYTRYLIGKAFLCMKKIMVDVYAGRKENPFPDTDSVLYSKTDRSRTSIIASAIFDVSPKTISAYGSYAKALDQLLQKTPDIAEEIFTKKLILSVDNTIQMSKMQPSDIIVICNHIKNHKDTRLLHSEMQRRLENKKVTAVPKKKRKLKVDAEIKNMPQFDPDAEINSLGLTIPMWVSSMKRTMDIADFGSASVKALSNLEEKLSNLRDAVYTLERRIKEENHE